MSTLGDWIRPARSHLAATWRRGPERPWVFGHRGARHAAPENTLAAFELALEEGADGIELDVRLDGDRSVVVLHDADLTRVTQGRDRRSVEAMTSAEVAEVDVGNGQRIPRLAEVLEWAERRGTRINVEIKSDVEHPAVLVSRVTRMLAARADSPRRILLSSFHPLIVAVCARRLPDVAVAWLVHDGQRILRTAPGWRWLGAAAIHPEAKLLDPRLLRSWRSDDVAINTWTVNDPSEAVRLAQLGVDTLISDNPGRLLAALND